MSVKKFLAFGLIATGILGSLAGCSSKSNQSSATSRTTTVSPAQQRKKVNNDMLRMTYPKQSDVDTANSSQTNPVTYNIMMPSNQSADNSNTTKNPQQVAQLQWHSIYNQLKKKGDTSKSPLRVVFNARKVSGSDSKPTDTDKEIDVAKTNSPKLHIIKNAKPKTIADNS